MPIIVSERERIYDQLLKDFEYIAKSLDGWQTPAGTALDGLLWKLAEKIALLSSKKEV